MIKKNKKNYQPRHVQAIVPPAQNELRRAASRHYMDEQKPDTIAEAAEEIGANQDEAAREKVAGTKPAADSKAAPAESEKAAPLKAAEPAAQAGRHDNKLRFLPEMIPPGFIFRCPGAMPSGTPLL